MGLFGFGKKEGSAEGAKKTAGPKEIAQFGHLLSEMVVQGLTRPNGTVVPEDAVTLMATITAERCLDAIGDPPLRDHELVPGSRVFRDKMDFLLFGDGGDGTWEKIPHPSVLATLRVALLEQKFQLADFPDLRGILRHFAQNADDPRYRFTVPLTVPPDNFPRLTPLKIGFESRREVDDRLRALPDRLDKVSASVWALMEILLFARQGLASPIALRLAVEVLYGMAKTAPMTARRMDEMKHWP